MTQKELKYQVALGAVDFAKIRGIDILRINRYKTFARLIELYLDDNTPGLTYMTFKQHKFYKRWVTQAYKNRRNEIDWCRLRNRKKI